MESLRAGFALCLVAFGKARWAKKEKRHLGETWEEPMTVLNTKAPLNTQAPLNQEMSSPHGGSNKKMRGASRKARLGLYIRGLQVRILAVLVLAAPFIASAIIPAQAAMFRLGEVDVQVDSTLSAGLSIRTAERDSRLLPARNGGPKDMTNGANGAAAGAYGLADRLYKLDGKDGRPARTAQQTILMNGVMGLTGSPTDAQYKTALATLAGGIFACGTPTAYSATAQKFGTSCMYNQSFLADVGGSEHYNYDSSINNDDGRLNFDQGDLIGGTTKFTTEIEASKGMATMFMRFSGFYDAVLDDVDNFERSGPLEMAKKKQVTDIDMLDFYLDLDLEAGDSPVLLRIGRQVINWGEATFILGGNSVFSPIDVPAFRRPGSEIKEALLPVNAIYASIGLSEALSVEAYYGGWDNYNLDAGGSPFAHSDAFELGSGGNGERFYVGSGAYSGSNRRNCTAVADGTDDNGDKSTTALFGEVFDAVFGPCKRGDAIDYLTTNPVGNVELGRQSYTNIVTDPHSEKFGVRLGDTDFLRRGPDNEPNASDNYGLALRWYAENLNSTEFGFYYQNYTSRIPYASSVAYQPIAGPNVASPAWSSTLRGATLSGCLASFATNGFGSFSRGVPKTDGSLTINGATQAPALLNDRQLQGLIVADPTGVAAALRGLYEDAASRGAIIGDAAPNLFSAIQGIDAAYLGLLAATGSTNADVTAAKGHLAILTDKNGGLTKGQNETDDAFSKRVDAAKKTARTGLNALNDANTLANLVSPNSGNLSAAAVPVLSVALAGVVNNALAKPDGSLAQGMELGCIGNFAQSTGGALLGTGTVSVATRYQAAIVAEYPEDIEVYGLSFNTTLGGWGVQGEVAYRPNMPLQLDGDAISIAALAGSCAWENFAAVADIYYGLQTMKTRCGDWNQIFHGYVREQVTNLDIGTTATFTRSNAVVSALGADLGVLLTEIGMVHVPDAGRYKEAAPHVSGIPRLANQCTSGSDLPLGGVFSLDPRTAEQCRPTETSSGIVLFGQLQYNNVFGTAIGLRPTLAYQRGIDGRSPSPAGSFVEDNYSLGLSLIAEYQGSWRASLGYTAYGGDALYNRNVDRDYASFSISYAF